MYIWLFRNQSFIRCNPGRQLLFKYWMVFSSTLRTDIMWGSIWINSIFGAIYPGTHLYYTGNLQGDTGKNCHPLKCFHWIPMNIRLHMQSKVWNNKRSNDLGALLDSCSWSDTGNFLQTCIKNSLLQPKSIEIWVNSDTVPHYACINLRSYSTP